MFLFIPLAIMNPNPKHQTRISKGQEGLGHCGPKTKKDSVVHKLLRGCGGKMPLTLCKSQTRRKVFDPAMKSVYPR